MNPRVKKFFSYYRPYLGLFLTDLACAFVIAAIALLMPLCTNYVIKNVLEAPAPDALNQIYLVGGVMLALAAIYTACEVFVDYRGHMMGTLMEHDMRRDLFDHYQTLSFGFFDQQRTGQLMTRLTNDLFAISELYHHGPEDLLIALLKFTGVFIIMAYINLELALIIFLFMPIMVVYSLYFNRQMNRALMVSHQRIGDVNAQVEDTLAGIRVVKSFTNEPIEQRKFAYENARFVDSRRAGYRSETYFYGGMTVFTNLVTISIVVFGSMRLLNASLGMADLVTFLMCVAIIIEPIQRLVNFARVYQEGITGFNRFMEMMEVVPEIKDAPDALELERARGRIEFRDVSFKYTDDHAEVLKHVSLQIGVGEYVALVGASGVGKTTLCSLIPRFYEVNAGRILVDSHDIRSLSQRSLRRNIGVVQQDVYLFAGTVAENICYGKPGASMEEIVTAAKQANAHEFILRLPQGYDTDVGQRGLKLSGGQKQRLSIARVFLKDPPIIIFDEATSSLDNESERAVQESLERLAHNRTTLVIAHRLSTIRNAQRIIVLTNTGVHEQGTHEELLEFDGIYASLYNMPLSF